MLAPLLPEIQQLGDVAARARYLLNYGQQALAPGGPGMGQAYAAYTEARSAAHTAGAHRIEVEALDALAQLYEDQRRMADAQTLNRTALQQAAKSPLGLVQDLLVRLEWRQSRLLQAAGQTDEALAAMQRAASYVETIRSDLPIETEIGLTTFNTLLQPIYIGLADLILQRQQNADAEGRIAATLAAISALELSRQAEMQDYLGERCAVVSATAGDLGLPAGLAVLYPLVLNDRVELLLKSGSTASSYPVKINPDKLRRLTTDMADGLRSYDTDDYLNPAKLLYDVLLRPLEAELAATQTDTLIIASEGFLRPIPMAALHDGKQFLVEKYALGTVTGMTMTDQNAPDNAVVSSLIAGLSEPGPVLDKLDPTKLGAVSEVAQANSKTTTTAQPTQSRSLNLRTMRTREVAKSTSATGAVAAPGAQRAAMAEALKLPGVETELKALSSTMRGTSLLNGDFTMARFGKEAASGSYRIVHIASHGIFGGDANSSFILAYDDVLTMNGLQTLLNSDNVKQSPIELLTLSACETAEGNERAPLGFSGAAIKARARSALGTLWPVADDAARQLMGTFYTGISTKKSTKAVALRAAQIELLQQPATAHPFFWAPFTLVGNWK
jgi:CHAT domain-containing protein